MPILSPTMPPSVPVQRVSTVSGHFSFWIGIIHSAAISAVRGVRNGGRHSDFCWLREGATLLFPSREGEGCTLSRSHTLVAVA